MADFEFVDPATGLALGAHAFGVIPAGTTSAAFAARLRYRFGQSGSGVPANALCLRLSEDGGATWRTDLRQFTIAITAVVNTPNDPLYTETVRSLGKGSRFRLAPMRAGCAVDLDITFTPDLRPSGGATQTDYTWEAGLDLEQWEETALVPGAPSGILTGLGDATVSEWVTAPSLANGTDEVTLGASHYVCAGIRYKIDGAAVALSQDDGSAVALASGEEYVAVLSVGAAGTVTVTKGDLATAGDALQPAYPSGELPLAVVRVPYGGAIATSTLLAVSGRCLVTDTGGLTYSVQPGRAVSPGMLASPTTVQTGTLPDESTSIVYLSPSGVANLTAGIPLKQFTTTGGDITAETDLRPILRPEPLRLSKLGAEAAADNVAAVYVPYAWTLDRMLTEIRVAAAGATGNTTVDVNVGGSGWTSDQIPAGVSTSEGSPAPPWNYAAGWVTMDIAGITTGGTRAADIEVLMWIVPAP